MIARVLALLLLCLASLAEACQSSVSTELEGKPCDAQQQCLLGYVCGTDNRCHTALDPDPPDPMGNCTDGLTTCDGKCVVLETDPLNCGGCGATCSAPAHGSPSCSDYNCDISCDRDGGWEQCGNVCVDFQNDAMNCGGCGRACPEVGGASPVCKLGECGVACLPSFDLCDGERICILVLFLQSS